MWLSHMTTVLIKVIQYYFSLIILLESKQVEFRELKLESCFQILEEWKQIYVFNVIIVTPMICRESVTLPYENCIKVIQYYFLLRILLESKQVEFKELKLEKCF